MISLEGRTAVVTGGSQGIGRAIALKLAENGADIAIPYIGNPDRAAETVSMIEALGRKVKTYTCDVSNFEQSKEIVAQIIEDFGKIDILVNNAGITRDGLALSMKEADFDAVIAVNLKGTFNMIHHFYQHFMKKRYGKIINIASVVGITGNAGQANYSASKAGVIGLTKTIAKELASRHVTCNAIAPGFINTDMTAVLSDKVKESMAAAIPLKRMGDPEDIANLALFLASDLSSYITGEVIRIDGGLAI